MKDFQIRDALKRKVLNKYAKDPDTLIVDELGLMHGATRIDIAVVNNILHGFEIKSDRDKITRLPKQMKMYNSVFDRVTLVVGFRHVRKAFDIIPDWWGVKFVKMGKRGAIYFSEFRKPLNNPSPDSLSIAKLLWREEALFLLDEIGKADGLRSKPRVFIYKKLAQETDLEFLRAKVRQQLRSRTNWRSGIRQKISGD